MNFKSETIIRYKVKNIQTRIGKFPCTKKKKQANRGDMRKIHVTRQFFEAVGPQGHFFEKTKNPFLDMVEGSEGTEFQACIIFS